jgi:hypothetical protein
MNKHSPRMNWISRIFFFTSFSRSGFCAQVSIVSYCTSIDLASLFGNGGRPEPNLNGFSYQHLILLNRFSIFPARFWRGGINKRSWRGRDWISKMAPAGWMLSLLDYTACLLNSWRTCQTTCNICHGYGLMEHVGNWLLVTCNSCWHNKVESFFKVIDKKIIWLFF